MSTEQNLWGGYVSDTDPSLGFQTSNLNFGLNQKITLTKFEYSTATGKGGAEGNPALIVEFDINGTSKNIRKYDPTVPGSKVYYRGAEVLDTKSPDYMAGLQENIKATKAYVTHILKAVGKTEEQIQAIYATATSFQTLMTSAQAAIQPAILAKQPLDIFLQFQRKITGDADRTFLDIPESLTYGAFLCAHIPAQGGEFKEEQSWTESQAEGGAVVKTGLRYVDGAGNVHRFERDENFMKSKVATVQTKVGATPNANNPMPVAQGNGNPQQQAWS